MQGFKTVLDRWKPFKRESQLPKCSGRLCLRAVGRGFESALSLASLAAVICAPASAGVIYQTGFESPTYTVGGLNGQDGWTNSTVPIVQTANVFSGTQAVQYSATGLSAQDYAIHSLTYNALTDSNQIVIGQIEMEISNTGTASGQDAILFRANGGLLVGHIEVGLNRKAFMANLTTTIGGSVSVPLGVWNLYTFSMNFQTQQFTAFVNDQLIGTLPFSNTYTSLSVVQFGLHDSPGTDSTFYDNLSIASVPEPSTLLLFATSAGILLLRRRSFR